MYNLVLADIQELASLALKDKEVFYNRLSQKMEKTVSRGYGQFEKGI